MQNPLMQNQAVTRSQSQTAKVLIFDSGVGALSVFQEILKINAQINCTLALDNALFPYGTQTEQRLIARILKCFEQLIPKYHPDIIVIACNTASTVVLNQLRERCSIPIVGVVPAIKPAAKQTKTQVIGLLATPATIERDYTKQLIEDFASHCQVVNVGSSALVRMAEQKLRGEAINLNALAIILTPFISQIKDIRLPNLDTLVLACTHFPLLEKEITQVLTKYGEVQIVDSGQAIAQRVQSLLPQTYHLTTKKSQETGCWQKEQVHRVLMSAQDSSIKEINHALSGMGCLPIEVNSF